MERGRWREIGAKGRIPISGEMNEMEVEGRREVWEERGKKEKKEREPRFRRRQGINQRWRENMPPLGSLFCSPGEGPNCPLAEHNPF